MIAWSLVLDNSFSYIFPSSLQKPLDQVSSGTTHYPYVWDLLSNMKEYAIFWAKEQCAWLLSLSLLTSLTILVTNDFNYRKEMVV